MLAQNPEQLHQSPDPEQRVDLPDIPKSRELFRGDINDAVIQPQLQTGVDIDDGFWFSQVGNGGSTENILDRFDAAYPDYVKKHIGLDKTELQKDNVEEMNARHEEVAWENYTPIGSDEYEQANQERIKDSKIKVAKFGDEQRSATLVASIKVDPETGQTISGHENRPDAESMRDTELAFADYLITTPTEQRIVIYEGDERIIKDRDEAIIQAADSGLVQHLAASEHVPTISGEPTEAETLDIMERFGMKREELLALYVARGLEQLVASGQTDFIAGYINHHAATLGVEGFHEFSEAEKQEIVSSGKFEEVKQEINRKVEQLLPVLNDLYKPILEGKDLLVVVDDDITINPEFVNTISEISMDRLSWSGEHRLNEVAKLNMEMRDRVIFHRIVEAYNNGKSPFVVYGGSHIVTLGPALQSYFHLHAAQAPTASVL